MDRSVIIEYGYLLGGISQDRSKLCTLWVLKVNFEFKFQSSSSWELIERVISLVRKVNNCTSDFDSEKIILKDWCMRGNFMYTCELLKFIVLDGKN